MGTTAPTMVGDNAIRTQELRKSYGAVKAVRGVSFAVRRGEIFSLLGPNGAGKSTTISMLAGLLHPDAGDAWIDGHSVRSDPTAAKAALGVVPQDIALYSDMSARDNLAFWGRMYGLGGAILRRRVDEVLETVGLVDRQKEAVGHFSGGMKRRLNVGVALLHRPQVVIMDEPTVGIDPQSRRSILDSIKALNRQGMSVLYTTHYMEEAQELSDHIAIVDQGRVVACGTHDELVKLVGELDRIDLRLSADPAVVAEQWRAIDGVHQVVVPPNAEPGAAGHDVTLLVEDANMVLPCLFEPASRAGVRIVSVEIKEPNLEAVFLHLTGRALRD